LRKIVLGFAGRIRPVTVAFLFALTLVWLVAAAPAEAAFPGANGLIAFSSNRDGDYDIYTMNPDGTGVTQLTDDPAPDVRPQWSADGTRIVFERDDPFCSTCRGGEIRVMNADGSSQAKLVSPAGVGFSGPAWSPDQQRVAFGLDDHCGGDLIGLDLVSADGISAVNIACPDRGTGGPDWSADGGTIVFHSGIGGSGRVYSVRPDGTGLRDLSNNQSTFGDADPNWSPDGQKIIFSSQRYAQSDAGLYLMNPDGSGQVKIPGTYSFDSDPAWSPAGNRWAFVRVVCAASCDREVYTLRTDGAGMTKITINPAQDIDPDWQPAGNPPLQAANLSLRSSDSPDPVAAGRQLTYTLQVWNGGPRTATSVSLWDTLSKRVRFSSVSASQGSCGTVQRTVSCALGDMPALGSATVTLVVVPKRQGAVSNTASVTATGPADPGTSNNTATATTAVRR
jgi:uncharacterized repeat protein (TIGR01451 family)